MIILDALTQATAEELMMELKSEIPHADVMSLPVGKKVCVIIKYDVKKLTNAEAKVISNLLATVKVQQEAFINEITRGFFKC